ncbi:MAG TPA: ferrochelatase [Candidatus Paceibacterota bacterium]|nr:ferrochelatase [Verrucomicrobiota bacterium]HRY47873.1 ferrochelatase [Candidatus Paceibacterota bacterium]HRZ99985.1 ferrochelatase [Candidatus Paceibacterota bacterium]
MKKQAVLLINLGSPDSPAVPDVRRYLKEFLMDERVIDLAPWKRWLLVHLLILPFRPRRTSEAYRKIWWPDGAPLVVISRRVQSALQQRLAVPVELAMRYQNPSIESALRRLTDRGIRKLVAIPLYPQYASSSYETVEARVREAAAEIAADMDLRVVPPFYNDPGYLEAWVNSSRRFLQHDYDHLLFSFHGIPERHLRLTDPTHAHCLQKTDCCQIPSPAHAKCYRAQAFRMVESFVKLAGVPSGKYSVAFQSRLGRDPWLKPYTDTALADLPGRGIRHLLVTCPAFVADCLETLEEIGMRGKETFERAGGKMLTLIPCLNAHPDWISALENLAKRHLT